jgi:hypothetical protein
MAEAVTTTPGTGVGPTGEQVRAFVESAWLDQAVWSGTASRLKRNLGRARAASAVGGVGGALLETIAAALPDDSATGPTRAVIALTGAVILAVVAVVVRTQVSQDRVHAWIRARSVAEAMKEELYRFLVGATPYLESRRLDRLAPNLEARRAKDSELAGEVAAESRPAATSRPTTWLTVDEYIAERVDQQIDDYYAPKAAQNARRGKLLRSVEFWLAIAAAALGAIVASDAFKIPAIGSGVAVITTAAGAVATSLAAGRYDAQAISFFGTADRLRALKVAFLANPRTPESISAFVDRCEQAISSENEAWLATWSKDPSPSPS